MKTKEQLAAEFFSPVIKVGDILRDHHGKGRNLARVEAITGTKVVLRYSGPRGGVFELPLAYLEGKACGWKLEAWKSE